MSLSATDFNHLRDLIKKQSGISLTEDKMYLIESRLLPLARSNDLKDITELVNKVRGSNDKGLITEIIEAMTTNETSFYRDLKPFQLFENEVIPHLQKHCTSKKVRIWCAASSTGQEPYSLAMTIKDQASLSPYSVEIHGTDIDSKIINRAKNAIYTQFEVQRGLPIMTLMKYFTQQESYGENWLLKQEIKDMVKYKTLNLLETYTSMGKFDVIFCRNVLIYFDAETKTDILNRLGDCLNPHGLLFLGSAENPSTLTDKYEPFNDIRTIHQLRK